MKHLVLAFAFFTPSLTFAQYYELPPDNTNESIGVGIGLDYGGIGIRGSFLSFNRVDLFGGIGYNLIGVGWNVGAAYRFDDGEKRVVPYGNVMYGYNAVILVESSGGFGTSSTYFEETYYGPSVGGGIELHLNNRRKYFNFELLIPIRDSAYQRDLDMLKSQGITFDQEPLPVTISVGYHIQLKSY